MRLILFVFKLSFICIYSIFTIIYIKSDKN